MTDGETGGPAEASNKLVLTALLNLAKRGGKKSRGKKAYQK